MLSFNYSGIHQNKQLELPLLISQHRLTEALEYLELQGFTGIPALLMLDLAVYGGVA